MTNPQTPDTGSIPLEGKPDIYSGELNQKRIKCYTHLADEYNLTIGTVRDIFCKGADFYRDLYSQQPPSSAKSLDEITELSSWQEGVIQAVFNHSGLDAKLFLENLEISEYKIVKVKSNMSIKSLKEIKNEYAICNGHNDWKELREANPVTDWHIDYFAELYAAQFKSQHNTGWVKVSDEKNEEVTRNPDTLYTYYKVEYKNCSMDWDETICEDLDQVKDAIQFVDTALDDDTDFEPGTKPSVIITGIGMTPRAYAAFLEEIKNN